MFIEPSPISRKHSEQKGQIEVICGSMFSGKTEELIRRLTRAKLAKQQVEIFKPAVDTRYHDNDVVSHNETSIRSTPVSFAGDVLMLAGNCDVVGIDEAQFFDAEIIRVVQLLANQGKRVILAGLDMDFTGKPFDPMPQLMAIAEYVTKVQAICMKCGDLAAFSLRLSTAKEQVLLGEKDSYEARCRKCFHEDLSVGTHA